MEKRQKPLEQVIKVRLKNLLLGLFAEVDQRRSGMRLHSGLGTIENRNDAMQNGLMVSLLHGTGEICAHLAKGVATGPSDSGVLVSKGGDDQVEDLI